MANSSKQKGDRAELEVQALLREHLGVPARRALGAGRKDDVGDIHGVPNTVISVTSRRKDESIASALRNKPKECETQRMNANADFAATFIRMNGGEWRVCLTVEQFATLWREAQ